MIQLGGSQFKIGWSFRNLVNWNLISCRLKKQVYKKENDIKTVTAAYLENMDQLTEPIRKPSRGRHVSSAVNHG